jgi:hypothetical protein
MELRRWGRRRTSSSTDSSSGCNHDRLSPSSSDAAFISKLAFWSGLSVLITSAAALRRRGDGVLGLDNFNGYYDPTLKRGRAALLARSGVYAVDGDVTDADLLAKLFGHHNGAAPERG